MLEDLARRLGSPSDSKQVQDVCRALDALLENSRQDGQDPGDLVVCLAEIQIHRQSWLLPEGLVVYLPKKAPPSTPVAWSWRAGEQGRPRLGLHVAG